MYQESVLIHYHSRNLNNTIALTTQWRIFDAGRSGDLKKKNISKKEEIKALFKLENKNLSKILFVKPLFLIMFTIFLTFCCKFTSIFYHVLQLNHSL